MYEEASNALIDTFSSSEREVKLSNAQQWHSRSDWLSPWRRTGGEGELCHSRVEIGCWKWIWSDRSAPQGH